MNAPATRLGKYDLVRALGEGAMGVVYEAVDSVIERTVAIKTIRKGDLDADEAAEHGRRFLIEAKAAGKLNHPNIVGLYDHGEQAGLAYLVMELVQGRELQHYFNERYAFTLGDIVRLMGELLDALGYSHRRGVIHRDVKPANIFITQDGHVKLGDFGIARIESSTRTRVGAVLGTPSHMAPEQIRGEGADARSDLYAAGVVLFQFLTGERPFTGTMLSMALKVLNEPAPRPSSIRPDLPAALDAVVGRALAKQPAERYQSAAEFWRALVEASGLGPTGAGGFAAGEAADTGFGRAGFGDTGFGRSGFGDTGFGRSGFGDTGFGRSGFGDTALGRDGAAPAGPTAEATDAAPRGTRPSPEAAEPTRHPRQRGASDASDTAATAAPPAPAAVARSRAAAAPDADARRTLTDPPMATASATEPVAPAPAGRTRAAVWAGAGALVTALAVAWWALRPAAPPPAPEARRDGPIANGTPPPPPASAPVPAAVAPPGPSAVPPPVAGTVPSASAGLPPAPPPVAPPPTAAAPPPAPTPAPALARTAPDSGTSPATPPTPAPRPQREARAAPAPKPTAEPAPSPPPKAARPARCSDILQKASLEPLTSDEAAYLRRECQ